jgi:hypothetical protein
MSLFSSVGYLRTPDRLAKAVRNMAHQAWKLRTRAPGATIVDKPEISIVRMIDWVRDGNVVKSTFHYLVGTDSSVEHFTEEHEMGLFTDDEHRSAFAVGHDSGSRREWSNGPRPLHRHLAYISQRISASLIAAGRDFS